MSVCGAPALPVVVDATAEPDPYPRRRDTVATFLAARSTVLGDLYRYASALLEDRRPEGWQHLAAHVGRELMNRLADHLAEVPVDDPDAPAAQSAPAANRSAPDPGGGWS